MGMFNEIVQTICGVNLALVGRWFTWLIASIGNLKGKLYDWLAFSLKSTGLQIGMFGVAIGAVWGLISWISSLWAQYRLASAAFESARMAASGNAVPAVTLGDVLAFMNYYAPVQEFLHMLSLACAVFLAAVTIRTVKSWIPTVN